MESIQNRVKNSIHEYNTSYIIEKYQEVITRTSHYALIQVNINDFRYFNTAYGTDEGDEILGIILDKFLSLLHDNEYVAHLYADNFVVLLECEEGDEHLCHRLIKMIDNIYRIDDKRLYRNLFMSFGIYLLEDEKVNFTSAYNFANLCRRESGGLNKRRFCFEIYNDAFYKQYMDRIDLENRTAEAYKEYKFVAFLQPKVDLETEEIVGAEALLRWFDEDGNNIPLSDFLPILDRNGYIQLIDLDVFDQICKKLDERIKANKKVVPVSFNISKSSFYAENILESYISTFEKYEIPKQMIDIEFMETISLDDTERMKKIVAGFKEYGFQCSLDDFGNGYSSFNVLLNANFDIVKMDRQFFLDNLKGDNKLVIQTVVSLIHSLNMKVVAEGVEKKEFVDYLKECGCDFVQGYYYYKPMPIEELERILDKKV